MEPDLNPTCPAMRHIWGLIKNGDKDLLNLYHNNAPLHKALHADVPITRLLMLYVRVRNILEDELTHLHLTGPRTIQMLGADPNVLHEAEKMRDNLAQRLTDIVQELEAYTGQDFGTTDPDEGALAYLKNMNRIKANQD